MSPRAKKNTDRDASYEQAFAELQEIVTRLESGEVPLEEAVALFERGQTLAKTCTGLLDKAELRIRQLGKPSDAGAPDD
jgi:exodeoxyribonuclease VII small subunit